jgi:hypothetical protein
MQTLISIDNVFNFVPRPIREEVNDDTQIKSWALQALRMVETPAKYIKEIWFHEVSNHSAPLPEGLHKIYKASFSQREPIEGFCRCQGTTEPLEILQKDCVSLYHTLYLQGSEIISSWQPLAYKGHKLSDKYVCKVDWGGCKGHYSLTSNLSHIRVSHESGFVAIEYLAEAKDEEGNFLVPDLPQLWLGMSHYIQAQHYNERAAMAEQNANNLYMQHLNLSRHQLQEARSILKMQHIDIAAHRALIKIPSRFSKINLKTQGR